MNLAAPALPQFQTDKGDAVILRGGDRQGRFVVVCEHGGRQLPQAMGDLGLSEKELESHIAWDPGAAEVAIEVARQLDSPLVLQRYSRLIYDCNRPPTSDDAMRSVSEVTRITGNENLSDEEKTWRTENIYEPFHAAVDVQLDKRDDPVLITVHSFTPVYNGKRRDVGVGILHDKDGRLADAILANNKFDDDIKVARNDPYGPKDGVTHTLQLHTNGTEILNVMVEIRNDLIDDEASQKHYADKLVETIKAAMSSLEKV